MVMLLPPVPALPPESPWVPPAPSTSTATEVNPAGGVQVPEPLVQVTVTVVVPDSLHVPVLMAYTGGAATESRPTDPTPEPRATAAPITASRRTPKRPR